MRYEGSTLGFPPLPLLKIEHRIEQTFVLLASLLTSLVKLRERLNDLEKGKSQMLKTRRWKMNLLHKG